MHIHFHLLPLLILHFQEVLLAAPLQFFEQHLTVRLWRVLVCLSDISSLGELQQNNYGISHTYGWLSTA